MRRRPLDWAWHLVGKHELNYADVAGVLSLREAISGHLGASRGVLRREPGV